MVITAVACSDLHCMTLAITVHDRPWAEIGWHRSVYDAQQPLPFLLFLGCLACCTLSGLKDQPGATTLLLAKLS